MRDYQDHTAEDNVGLELSLDILGNCHLPQVEKPRFEQSLISYYVNLVLKLLII